MVNLLLCQRIQLDTTKSWTPNLLLGSFLENLEFRGIKHFFKIVLRDYKGTRTQRASDRGIISLEQDIRSEARLAIAMRTYQRQIRFLIADVTDV